MIDASSGLRGIDGEAWVTRLDRELDNWRAAIAYAIEVNDLDALAELFGSITTLALYGTRAGSAFAAAAADALAAIGEPDHAATAALLALTAYDQYLGADYAGAVATGHHACGVAERHPLRCAPSRGASSSRPPSSVRTTRLPSPRPTTTCASARETGDPYTLAEGTVSERMALATLGRHDEARAMAAQTAAAAKQVAGPLIELHMNFMRGVHLPGAG